MKGEARGGIWCAHKSHRSHMSHTPLIQDHFSAPELAGWQHRLGVAHPMAVSRSPLVSLDHPAVVAELAARLSPPELARLRDLTLVKRRQEWLAGRLAAKHAACRVLRQAAAGPEPAWPEIAVINQPAGRPALTLLAGPPRRLPQISISHSHGWAVAMAVMGAPCGIDLQRISAKTLKLRERFCLLREQEEVTRLIGAQAPPEQGLTLLWAAKEAVRKGVVKEALPGFLAMELVEVHCPAAGQWVLILTLGASGARHAVAATFWRDFALAFTVDEQGCLDCRGLGCRL